MNPSIFRRYDIRGVVARDLPRDFAVLLGRALGTRARRAGAETFGLAFDARSHSPALREALLEGLRSCGLEILDFGLVPTPVLYFAVFHFNLGGGVMITGSHNPPEFNGFKMMIGRETIHSEEIQALRAMIETCDFDSSATPGTVRQVDVATPYVNFVRDNIQLPPSSTPLKVVVDAGNGAAGPIAVRVFEALGLDVVPMYIEPDGTFPNHHPDPTESENVQDLIQRVRAERADLGVAFDGDGDRIGVVDERGEIIWGDRLMIILSRALLAEVPGATIVGEVKCSQTLYDDVRAHGGNAIMWKVGHSLIKDHMKTTGALLAGEMSGHIFYKHRYFGFDDATYTAARLFEIIAQAHAPVSSLLNGVPETFATPELRLEVPEEIKFQIAQTLTDTYSATHNVVAIDGVRILFPSGAWGLVRASNTQPALVLRVEATSAEERDRLEMELRSAIDEAHAALSA